MDRLFTLLRQAVALGALSVAAHVVAAPLSAQETVSIPTPDGEPVVGDLYGVGTRAVVLAHGGRFDRTSWADQARVLAGAGLTVLAIDFRAAVDARSGRDTPCLYDERCLAVDVLAAVRFLRRAGATSVSVVGASLGGGAAAQAAVDADSGEVDRVVLLAHMAIATPERMRGRKLFITARDDPGPGDVSRLVKIRSQYERAPEPKELVILEGTAHAQFLFGTTEGERLMQELLRFLTQP
jgi:dienelactone hydrolase